MMRKNTITEYPWAALALGLAAGVVLSLLLQMAAPQVVRSLRSRLGRGEYVEQAMLPADGTQGSKKMPVGWPEMLVTNPETRTHIPRTRAP